MWSTRSVVQAAVEFVGNSERVIHKIPSCGIFTTSMAGKLPESFLFSNNYPLQARVLTGIKRPAMKLYCFTRSTLQVNDKLTTCKEVTDGWHHTRCQGQHRKCFNGLNYGEADLFYLEEKVIVNMLQLRTKQL